MNKKIKELEKQCWNHQTNHLDAEKFAELVAAHEREKVASWMMSKAFSTGHGDTIEDLLNELDWQINEIY